MHEASTWAEAQFGHADLGDVRRTRRLVRFAAEVVRRPSGIVSRSCATSASREGAFRFLENSRAQPRAVSEAVFEKTARDCEGKGLVVVAVDATAISLKCSRTQKGLGPVGPPHARSRGVHAMTALALDRDGTPIGVAAQELWTRSTKCKGPTKKRRPNSEVRNWLRVVVGVEDRLAASDTRPWFQMDRGADATEVLALLHERGVLATVRASFNRRLDTDECLWTALERAPIVAKQRLRVAARSSPTQRRRHVGGKIVYSYSIRRARIAKLEIRAAQVELSCPAVTGSKRVVIPVNVVFVRETHRPAGDRIEWMLLTTHPITTREEVLAVVEAYTLRWRIEDFHRAWKNGLCRVEETKLRSRDAIDKWSTILATVATRAMRLTHLARQTPDALASTEFSNYELEAILIQRKPKGFDRGCIPTMTLGQAIRWIADTAGYNGPWKGPPGVQIVGRGLYEIEIIARAFEAHDREKK